MSMVDNDMRQALDYIKGLPLMKLADFIEVLQDELGIKGAPMFMPAGAPAPAASAESAEPVMEKNEFEVYLVKSGDNKVGVIKIMRRCIDNLSLVDAKKRIDEAAGPILLKKCAKEEANTLKAELESVGASAEVK